MLFGFKPIASFRAPSTETRNQRTDCQSNSGNVGLFGWGATISQLRIVHCRQDGQRSFELPKWSRALDARWRSGRFQRSHSSIRRSSSSGSVHATGQRIGGIAGQTRKFHHRQLQPVLADRSFLSVWPPVDSSFSAGAVVGSDGFFGGFAGASFGTISDSFWDHSSGRMEYRAGKSTYQMKTFYFHWSRLGHQPSGGTWKKEAPIPCSHGNPCPYFSLEVFFHPGIIIENQPAGAFAGKVHLVNSHQ